MNGVDMLILFMAARYRACIRSAHLIYGCALSRLHSLRSSLVRQHFFLDAIAHTQAAQAIGDSVEGEINHWNRVERQELAHRQSAHNCDAERMPQFRTD